MLEIQYKENTGEITAAASSPNFSGGHLEPKVGQRIALLDCPIPDILGAVIYDEVSQSLLSNPTYIVPLPERDYGEEIDEIKEKLNLLLEKSK